MLKAPWNHCAQQSGANRLRLDHHGGRLPRALLPPGEVDRNRDAVGEPLHFPQQNDAILEECLELRDVLRRQHPLHGDVSEWRPERVVDEPIRTATRQGAAQPPGECREGTVLGRDGEREAPRHAVDVTRDGTCGGDRSVSPKSP